MNREAELSAPVEAWLRARGYEVYVEVPFSYRNVDMVGAKDGRIIAVELKTSLSRGVLYQSSRLTIGAHEVYAAVGTKPRQAGVDRCYRCGVGVLSVRDGKVDRVAESTGFMRDGVPVGPSVAYLKILLNTVAKMEPGGVGGKPNEKGVGPAADVERAVAEYRETRPLATWREMFDSIQNHYVSAQSMCGAMKKIKERRYYREREHEERTKRRSLPPG